MEITGISSGNNGFTHAELEALAKNIGQQIQTEGEKAAAKLKEQRDDSAEPI